MKDIFSSRLKMARLMRGLSMDDLSKLLKGAVTKQSISKYEQGKMLPSSNILLQISKALQLPVDYFFRQGIQIGKISFREDYRLPAHSSEQLIALAHEKVERYLILENLLTLDSTFKNPLQRIRVATFEEAERAAEQLRHKWQLGTYPIFSVYEMLENAGIKVIEFEAGEQLAMAFSTTVEKNTPIVVINTSNNTTVERKRFSALHELGHLLLNLPKEMEKKTQERMCHRFAAAVLCPASVFIKELGEHRTAIALDELTSLKSRYGISVAAIVHRAKDLDVISADYYNHVFNHLIHQNIMEEGWGGYPIPERTDRFERLLQRAVAEQVISLSRAAELANEKTGDYCENLMVV